MHNNLKDDFEKLYMRFNIIQRAIKTIPPERMNEILNDVHFKRCTKYIASCVYKKHRVFLTSHGFWKEDIESIAQIFGISFYLWDTKADSKKGENTLLMRYVSHKFQNFITWARRKFGMDEKVYEMTGMVFSKVRNDKEIEPLFPNDDSTSLRDQIEAASEDYEDLRVKILTVRGPEKSKLRVKSGIIRRSIATMNVEKKKQIRSDKKLTASLLKKLDKEWPQHKDTLSYYATSKYVPFDMRKRAKKFCKKYGIDYVEWAKGRLNDGTMNEEEVSLT